MSKTICRTPEGARKETQRRRSLLERARRAADGNERAPRTPPAKATTFVLGVYPGESLEEVVARAAVSPSLNAAATLHGYARPGIKERLDLNVLLDDLEKQAQAIHDGDMKRAEAMLFAQAQSLEAIFTDLARRAATSQYLDGAERYLRLALKAQSQCARTLEALSTLKNPPAVAFVRQANIAGGHQQVNNGAIARAGETGIEQPKLLETQHGERLDSGAEGTASGADPQVATLGEVNGAEKQGGEGPRQSQRIQGRKRAGDSSRTEARATRAGAEDPGTHSVMGSAPRGGLN